MTGKQLTKLTAQLAAGSITQDYIKDKYGAGILTQVVAGLGAGYVMGEVAEALYDTPVIGDAAKIVAEPVADVVSGVLDLFGF
jgi:hypothetical protein